jgi:hypothetical protein
LASISNAQILPQIKIYVHHLEGEFLAFEPQIQIYTKSKNYLLIDLKAKSTNLITLEN